MDLIAKELQFLSITDILKQSISIPKQSPKAFCLITLTLIFPLSFTILGHSLFTHPILSQLESDPTAASSDWSKLLVFRFFYLIFLFAFFILSTASVVFTVASFYTSKPVSFSSTIAAIPSVFKCLFITFLWVSLSMVAYNIIFLGFLVFLIFTLDAKNVFLFLFSLVIVFSMFLGVHVYISALWHLASIVSVHEPVITYLGASLSVVAYTVILGFLVLLIAALDKQNVFSFLFSLVVVFLMFLGGHVYIIALWYLASVVSVLEPVYGFAAMKKSYELLNGKTGMGFVLVSGYLTICGAINMLFGSIVVHGGDDYSVLTRILVAGILVGLLVIVNLMGLLVQSVFYYICKSYHHQGIDKSALYGHLGGYLGEYVPLKSSIQMKTWMPDAIVAWLKW